MPRRAKVGTVRRSYSLPAELVEALEETADELDLNPGVLVRYAITGYLNNLELPPAGALNSDRLNAATAPIARTEVEVAEHRLDLERRVLRFCPVTKLDGSTCGLPIPCADHNATLAEEARRRPGVPLASGFEPEHGGERRPSRGGVDTGPGYRLPGHYGGTGA